MPLLCWDVHSEEHTGAFHHCYILHRGVHIADDCGAHQSVRQACQSAGFMPDPHARLKHDLTAIRGAMIPACKLLTVQAALLQMLDTSLPWETLGAIPEMLQTAWGSLFRSLQLKAGDRLLIRGGTTSVGLAAASIAKKHGAYVAATTRSAKREELVKSSGADHVFIDDGAIAKQAKAAGGFDKVHLLSTDGWTSCVHHACD